MRQAVGGASSPVSSPALEMGCRARAGRGRPSTLASSVRRPGGRSAGAGPAAGRQDGRGAVGRTGGEYGSGHRRRGAAGHLHVHQRLRQVTAEALAVVSWQCCGCASCRTCWHSSVRTPSRIRPRPASSWSRWQGSWSAGPPGSGVAAGGGGGGAGRLAFPAPALAAGHSTNALVRLNRELAQRCDMLASSPTYRRCCGLWAPCWRSSRTSGRCRGGTNLPRRRRWKAPDQRSSSCARPSGREMSPTSSGAMRAAQQARARHAGETETRRSSLVRSCTLLVIASSSAEGAASTPSSSLVAPRKRMPLASQRRLTCP